MFRTQLTKRAVIGHALLPVSVALFLTFLPLKEWVMVEGSQAYLDFSAQHSLGYPLFLALISFFSPERFDIAHVQIWIYALSVFSLSISLFRVSTNHFLAILSTLCLLVNPYALDSLFTVLPNALFISLSLLALSFLLHAMASPSIVALSLFGASLGLCIAVEPFGFAYVPLILIGAPLCVKRNHCSFAKAFLTPALLCIAVIALEARFYQSVHKGQDYQPSAPYLFASAALMDSTQSSPYAQKDPRTGIWEKIESDLQGVRQSIWSNAPFSERKEILHSQQIYVANEFALNALTQAGFMLDKSENDIRMDIASSRIIQDPLAFVEITLTHYRAIWFSENMLSFPFWILSLLTSFIGLWVWLRGEIFNGAFAAAFCSALIIQGQTLFSAHFGLGPETPLFFLSPFFTLNIIGLMMGVYMTFISPPRTNG